MRTVRMMLCYSNDGDEDDDRNDDDDVDEQVQQTCR